MPSFGSIDDCLILHSQSGLCNYFEFVLLQHNTDDVKEQGNDRDQGVPSVETLKTSMHKDTFYALMYKMMDTQYKYSHKQYRELIVGDVHYLNHKNEEVGVFSITTHAVENIDDKFCMFVQQKNKHSILSLSSSRKIYNDSVVRKMVFRISNRVFVNFEHGMTDDSKYYKIFVNYNHDTGVDINNAINTIKKTMALLSQ